MKERKYDSSRKGTKKIHKFREDSTKISTETGCSPEMKGSFWPKMLLKFRNAAKDEIFPKYVNDANVSYFPSNTKNDWFIVIFFYFDYFPKLILFNYS